MGRPLKLLLVEDSERDAALLLLYLKRGGYEAEVRRVETEAQMKDELESRTFDAVVSDFNLPGFDAFGALALVREKDGAVPFFAVSGDVPEAVIGRILEAGATEFLFKDQLKDLVAAIERAIAPRSGSE